MADHNNSAQTKKGKFRFSRVFLVILGLLILIRLALPYIVLHFANEKLAKLDGHYGQIRDIDIALYRGAYVIKDIYIDKTNDDRPERTEFFRCDRIDLSVEWSALLDKKFVGEVEFEKPVVKYVMDKNVGKNAEPDTTDFIQLVKDFMPLEINRFAIAKGEVHYIDPTSNPVVDVPVDEIMLEAKGFTNKSFNTTELPATIDMTANMYDGKIDVGVKLDPLVKAPTFDLNASLTKTNLVNFNPFFKAYGDFDLKKGNMSIYAEFAAKQNAFKGYVKPVIMDLDIVQFNKEEGNVLQILWEAFIGSTAEILQNQRKGTLATKVPIEGNFKKPDVQIFDAIISVLKNAFVEALRPSIDETVNIYKVGMEEKKKGLAKLFSKDDKKAGKEAGKKDKKKDKDKAGKKNKKDKSTGDKRSEK